MRAFPMLLLAAATACSQSPEPITAKRTVVTIPRPKPQSPRQSRTSDRDADDIPSSHRDSAEEASAEGVEEEAMEEEAGPPRLFPSAAGGPTGGPDCDAVADCCHKYITTMGSVSADPRICEQYRNAPTSICASTLQQLQTHAIKAGIRCGP